MEIPQSILFTDENITELFRKGFELEELRFKASDALLAVRDGGKGRKTTTVRESREVNEELLWVEVTHLGLDSDAGETLRKLYPEVIEMQEKVAQSNYDLQQFAAQTFGVNYKAWTFADMVRIFNGVVEYQLRKHNLIKPLSTPDDRAPKGS